jgi:Carboxypeptidase regulatory-like domain/TonB dependent receptor
LKHAARSFYKSKKVLDINSAPMKSSVYVNGVSNRRGVWREIMTSLLCSTLCSTKNIVFVRKSLCLRFLFVLLVALIGFSASTLAQTTGTIVGTVTDPSGAVVPNVTVTLTNTDTGLTRVIPTNDAGQYVAVDIQIGHYTVKAEAKGFKVSEQKDIVLTVSDRIRVDFQMQMGAAQETVTVEAAVVHIQTDSGEVSNLISGQEVSELSTNGRSIYSLALLTPGASSNMPDFQVATPVGGSAAVSINGMRYAHNIWLLDGGEDDDRGGSGGISVMPSVDAIGEFRALTSNYSADYGLSSAGTMTLVLKSGTSQIHASAWEFVRNDALDARNYFNPAPQGVAELRNNVWGFNVGGPVTFGHLYNPDKKKTFFFYNMEWRRLVQGGIIDQTVPPTAAYPSASGANFTGTGITVNVPTAAQVAPAVLYAGCGGVAPTGVVQGSPFPNDTIPACMVSGNAQALLTAGIFPKANATASNGNPTFIGGNNSPTSVKEEIARIDHTFTPKFSVFGHWISEQISQGFGESQWSGDNVPTVADTFGNPSYSAVIHTTYIISPTLVNEAAFNYNGNRINIIPFAGSGLTSLGLPTGYTPTRLFSGPNNDDRIPNIDLSGGSNTQFEISSWPWKNKADDYQIRDDISWTKGAHQIKFGGSWALYKKIQALFGETQGGFNFNGNFTGNSFGDFLLGTADSYSELAVQDSGHWNNVSWATYVQDNWRVNKRLTLNLGLRWDGVPHTYEANNRMGNFYSQLYNPANAATVLANGTISPTSLGLGTSPNPILAGVPIYLNGIGIPGQCYSGAVGGNFCVPKGLVNNHWAAFGPRLGFAYDVTGSGKTVIRGGFGIMYERIQGNDMYDAGPNIPFSLTAGLNNVSFQNPNVSLLNGLGSGFPIVPATINGLDDLNYKLPVSYQYSLGVQHSLTAKTVLTVQYVGNQERHQSEQTNYNLVNPSQLPALINGTTNYAAASTLAYPGFGALLQANNEADGNYNALQVSLNGQLTKDLQTQFAYTWSKAMDPSTGGDNGDLATVSNPYAGWKFDYGPSAFDRTNIFLSEFVYDIPLLRHSSNRFLKTVVAGWTTSGIVTIESGLPVNLTVGGALGSNGLPDATNRPSVSGAIGTPHTVGSWFNNTPVMANDPVTGVPTLVSVGNFLPPTVGDFGNLGYDAVRGPGRDNWNLSLFKSFLLSESRGSRLEFRCETFNTWNHTQFNSINGSIGYSFNKDFNEYLPNSGQQFGQATSAFDPRVFQLGLKLFF